MECRNYIRTLHKVNDTTMYVCGTNAFSPTCDYMVNFSFFFLDPEAKSTVILVYPSTASAFSLSRCLFSCQTFVDGQLRLEGKQEKGQGKCPFDPFQRYSSLMVGECLHQVLRQRNRRKNDWFQSSANSLSAAEICNVIKVPHSVCIRV